MPHLVRWIVLCISVFCAVLGVFLLGSNLELIPLQAAAAMFNLWPVLLISVGILLFVDSVRKRKFTRTSGITRKSVPIDGDADAHEVLYRVDFASGRLQVEARENTVLQCERIGPMPDPVIVRENRGPVRVVSLSLDRPVFSSFDQIQNAWVLGIARRTPVQFEIRLHEAHLLMDLRRLPVDRIDLRADTGTHEIVLGAECSRLKGRIYSSSDRLSITLPAGIYARVNLVNPFCSVEWPQGDLERSEDGSFFSPAAPVPEGESMEINVDGPIKRLVLDVAET
jgi:hypothetical protein